jgi:hypothetical protein
MSGNIVIRQGLDAPWELNKTDITKPDDINLFNLAVGQLAQLGSDFGSQIAVQANITAEIGEAVNIVQDRSAEVAGKLDTWSQPVDFGFTKAPALSSIINKTYDPTDPNNIVTKLLAATDILKTTDVLFDSSKVFTASFQADTGTVSFVDTSTLTQNVTVDFSVDPPTFVPVTVPDLQIYYKWLSPGVWDSSRSVNYLGKTYTVTSSFKDFWVPANDAEISTMQVAAQASTAASNTALLNDKTQVLPTPSDTVDSATLPADAKVTLDVIVGDATGTRFQIPGTNGKYFYVTGSLDQLKSISSASDLVAADVNSVVKLSTGGYAWVYQDTILRAPNYISVDAESFVPSPTALQKASWISQYSDKIVRITQRSAEQANFLKMLTDRYSYCYDAATNVLQVFASLMRQQARF